MRGERRKCLCRRGLQSSLPSSPRVSSVFARLNPARFGVGIGIGVCRGWVFTVPEGRIAPGRRPLGCLRWPGAVLAEGHGLTRKVRNFQPCTEYVYFLATRALPRASHASHSFPLSLPPPLSLSLSLLPPYPYLALPRYRTAKLHCSGTDAEYRLRFLAGTRNSSTAPNPVFTSLPRGYVAVFYCHALVLSSHLQLPYLSPHAFH